MVWYHWFLLSVALSNAYELKCNQSSPGWSQQDSLPDALALKYNYRVVVRHTDWHTETTSLITEIRTANEAHITLESRAANTTHFILGPMNYTYNDNSCSALPQTSALPSIYLHSDLAKIYNFNGTKLAELINFLLQYNFTQHQFEDNTVNVGGINAVLWLGCRIDSDKIMQVEVAFAGDRSLASYSSTVKNPYILAINITAFNVTSGTFFGNESIYVTELENLPNDMNLNNEIPEGLFCSGFPEAKRPIAFPKSFEMSCDYTDVNGKVVQNIDMLYNEQERIFAMRLNAKADRDAPFAGNASIPKGLNNVHIIHDFKYGLQYLLDADNSKCSSVSMIDENFGDVEILNKSTKEIDLKKPAQLFWSTKNSTFYYAGRRKVNSMPLDVFVTKINHTPTTTTVVEMLYTTDEWVVETAVAPFLHSIIQYHKNEGKESKTLIHVHSFKNGSSAGYQETPLSVYPCLKIVDNSYLYFNIRNSTLKDLENLGIGKVREGLREAVAHFAGISVLRIANFFFKQFKENVVAFFIIGEATDVKPANTFNRSNETSAESAVKLLNMTLEKQDITITIVSEQRKVELKLSKSSLGTIPSTWGPLPSPAPSFQGYTGGSMFVLGFFTFLLGIAFGFSIVYFIWKRQRITGLAYQVFE